MLREILHGALGVGLTGAFAICDSCKPAVATAAAPVAVVSEFGQQQQVKDTKTVRLKVDGMTCAGCAIGARKLLTRLDGVSKAEVNYEKAEAVVTYDAKKVTVAQLIAAIEKLGYKATVIKS